MRRDDPSGGRPRRGQKGGAPLQVLALGAFTSFSWGAGRHFRRNGRMPVAMRTLAAGSLMAYLAFAAGLRNAGPPSRPRCLVASSLFVSGTVLFWWTVKATWTERPFLAHVPNEPSLLLRDGPYRLVRHPFYLSYLLFWAATALAGDRWQRVAASVLAGWYVGLAAAEERRFLRSGLGGVYETYRGEVPMLAPLRFARRGWGHGI